MRHPGRRGVLAAAATACTVTGTVLLALSFAFPPEPPPALPPSTTHAPNRPPGASPAPHEKALPRSVPTRITSRQVGLRAVVERVALAEDGSVALPDDADRAGWYAGSATPGEAGNAIVVGHVDSGTGPAAFYELSVLRKGDHLAVERRDGRTARFTVTSMAVHPKDDVPVAVYRPTLSPRLTLITCTGWDDEADDYRENIVITATLDPPD